MKPGHRTDVGLRPDFLSKPERKALHTYGKAPLAPWLATHPGDVWTERIIPHHSARSDIRSLLHTLRARIIEDVMLTYQLTAPLYADSLMLTRWRFGDHQAAHADSENEDGSEHPYPWRAYGAIIYLNDDYEGGELVFPELEWTPKTKPGTLAFFPGTAAYLHGVTPVMAGIRYTLATFLTHDKSKADTW